MSRSACTSIMLFMWSLGKHCTVLDIKPAGSTGTLCYTPDCRRRYETWLHCTSCNIFFPIQISYYECTNVSLLLPTFRNLHHANALSTTVHTAMHIFYLLISAMYWTPKLWEECWKRESVDTRTCSCVKQPTILLTNPGVIRFITIDEQ